MKNGETESIIGGIIIVIIIILGGFYFWGQKIDNELQIEYQEKKCGEYSIRDFKIGVVSLKCVKELELEI